MKMNNVNTNKIDANKLLLRVILAAAAVLIFCGIFCGAAAAATSGTSGGIDWSISDDGTLTISPAETPRSGYQKGQMKNYSAYDRSPWDSSRRSLKTLVICDGVTTIGEYAFTGCYFTGSLSIPDSVTTIGIYAFNLCSGFSNELIIPNSVTTIGERAFKSCSGFTSLTIGDHVTTIGESAFYDCSGFTSLTIGTHVTTIGNYAFWGCSGFTGDLKIPDSVTTIGNYAFWGCSGFTGDLKIPDSVTTIGESAFEGCSGFTSLTIGDHVTTIGKSAFEDCSGFTSLTIGDHVTTIENYAFWGCSGFTGDLKIPDSVTTIGIYAFNLCSGFTGLLIIPDSVTTIGNNAFNGCSNFDIIYIAGTPSLIEGKYDTQIPLAATLGGKITEVPEKPDLATPKKAGYAFGGWYTNPQCSGSSVPTYSEGGKYYAKWIPGDGHEMATVDFENKTAALNPNFAVNRVTVNESDVNKLYYNRSSSITEKPPETIDGKKIVTIGDAFILALYKQEEPQILLTQQEEPGQGVLPLYPTPDAGINATLSGKLDKISVDGYENELMLAQKTETANDAERNADEWRLIEVGGGVSDGDKYTFTADFISTKDSHYAFVLAKEVKPTPKESSTQGTSIWLTAEPTPTETPTPTPTPAPEAPSVKPVEQKPAAQTGASPAPVMGVLAGLGCAAVVFGLRRR